MLTESERAAIRRHHAHNLDAKKVDTARMYGVHPSVISRILQPQKHRKHRVTLTDKQKMEIRRLFHDNPDLKRKVIADRFGISTSSTYKIFSGEDRIHEQGSDLEGQAYDSESLSDYVSAIDSLSNHNRMTG
ncbi:hypothetical protein FRB95_013809 [Tulasnella sp. JGI-2019a]|nr:hypothetical protein FRB95_013809 [Tulasnella sp. JGI-2019a]